MPYIKQCLKRKKACNLSFRYLHKIVKNETNQKRMLALLLIYYLLKYINIYIYS